MDIIRINKLRDKIINHIENGGTIYDKKENLPYYEYMRGIKRDLVKELGREVAYEDVYDLWFFSCFSYAFSYCKPYRTSLFLRILYIYGYNCSSVINAYS